MLFSGDFRAPGDLIQFLRFLEVAGNYGEHYFRKRLIHSLEALCDHIFEASIVDPM